MHSGARILAVVTGANRGMGKVVIQKLAAAGMEVVATARSFDDNTKASSHKITWHKLDVSDDAAVKSFSAIVTKEYGPESARWPELKGFILINNAAIYPQREYDPVTFDSCMRTNLRGPVQLMDELLPLMRQKRWGRIIDVSSGYGALYNVPDGSAYRRAIDQALAAQSKSPREVAEAREVLLKEVNVFHEKDSVGSQHAGVYKVSKAALNTITRLCAATLRHEGLDKAIFCCAVDPGWVRTDMGGASATRSVEDGASAIAKPALMTDAEWQRVGSPAFISDRESKW